MSDTNEAEGHKVTIEIGDADRARLNDPTLCQTRIAELNGLLWEALGANPKGKGARFTLTLETHPAPEEPAAE